MHLDIDRLQKIFGGELPLEKNFFMKKLIFYDSLGN